jgi:hypothetical protein
MLGAFGSFHSSPSLFCTESDFQNLGILVGKAIWDYPESSPFLSNFIHESF